MFVAFGITGDLAKVMTLRSLYRLERRGLLSCPIVGVAVQDWSVEDLREPARLLPRDPAVPVRHRRDGLSAAGLLENARVVAEKPFGHDLESARELAADMHTCLDESQLFRIDHSWGRWGLPRSSSRGAPASPTAWTRRSARTGERSRAASASASWSRAPWSPARRCSCSTSRRPHLDPRTATALVADLLSAAGDRAVLLITHRPEGLGLVDEIVNITPRG